MKTTAFPHPRWTYYGLGALIGFAILAVLWVQISHLIWWLAMRPEVGTAFQHPRFGRGDAWMSLASFLLLTPFVAVGMAWALTFIYALPAGLLLPLGRRYGVPEWISTLFVVAASMSVLYAHTDYWVSPALRGIGLLARAFIVVAS